MNTIEHLIESKLDSRSARVTRLEKLSETLSREQQNKRYGNVTSSERRNEPLSIKGTENDKHHNIKPNPTLKTTDEKQF